MALTRLAIQHFRNLSDVTLELSPSLNIFQGANGSGKTSLLEAISYLGILRSFRTAHAAALIQHDHAAFCLLATLSSPLDSYLLGIEKTIEGMQHIRLKGETIRSASVLAKELPHILLNCDSFQLVHGGPLFKRQYLDWLLFHVEQCFLPTWQRWSKILKQRNSALKQRAENLVIAAWDEEWLEASLLLTTWRQEYFEIVKPLCLSLLKHFFPQPELFTFYYYPGWPPEADLAQILRNAIWKDKQIGYTTVGPQRANIICEYNARPITEILSRGQQKVFIFVWQLALALAFQQRTGQNTLFLLDDLGAEIDENYQQVLLSLLLEQQAQVFLTTIETPDKLVALLPKSAKMFHVEHGRVA